MSPCILIPCAVCLIGGLILGFHPLKVAAGFTTFAAALLMIAALG